MFQLFLTVSKDTHQKNNLYGVRNWHRDTWFEAAIIIPNQCDQIEQHLKLLGTNFSQK